MATPEYAPVDDSVYWANNGGYTPPPGSVPVRYGNQGGYLPPEQANAHNQQQYDNAAAYDFNGQGNPYLPAAPPTKYDVPPAAEQPTFDFGTFGQGGGYTPQAFNYAAFSGPNATPGAFRYDKFQSDAWQAPEEFVSPGAFEGPGAFKAPTMADITNDPGYQFRLQEGQGALERSAAARGTLLTGGTLKDITAFGQNLASTEYDKVYDRKFGEYQVDYNRQFGEYKAEYDRQLNENKLLWDRSLTEYTTNYNRLFGEHQQNYGQARDAYGFMQQNMLTDYNKALQEYQMGYSHAKDNWATQEQAGANNAANAARAEQERIQFLKDLAGL